MTIEACEGLFYAAMDRVTAQINADEIGDFNEATIQHHLAMALLLIAKESGEPFSIVLEKRVTRENGDAFPKKQSQKADIDIFYTYGADRTRCAIELKVYKRINHREPNNRYDAYADLANLEAYHGEHSDIGFFALFTDHPHYFDNNFKALSAATSDFSLREDHHYQAGHELQYQTAKPYGPNLALERDFEFRWSNIDQVWRRLLLEVR